MSKIPFAKRPQRLMGSLLIAGLLASACASPTPNPPTIVPGRQCVLKPGEQIPMAVTGGGNAAYQWSASAGIVTPPTGTTITYTAPTGYGGQVIIRVSATVGNQVADTQIVCTVELEPSPTPTNTEVPEPTPTPIPTAPPTTFPPIACNHPSVTGSVFPQLEKENGQFPFYGPLDQPESIFLCQAVYDIVHSPPLAVRLEYHPKVSTEYGFWGIDDPKGFAATSFKQICFWAYAEQPNQAFYLKLKTLSGTEKKVQVNVQQLNLWTQFCTDLAEFSNQGVDLASLRNVHLGFEPFTADATVWVDDFEFRE